MPSERRVRPQPAGAPGVPRVRLTGIGKAFGGTPVLRDVTVHVPAGHVLGLVGENGAGKSTLMNILGGVIRPDAGSMELDGRPYAPRSAADARAAGIAFVHQELTLFPNLTVAENLQLAAFPRRLGLPWIDRRASMREAAILLRRVGLPQPPDAPLARLAAGERQLVEIARALGAQARVLILDEPTTSLGASDRERLLALVRGLRDEGMAVVYISHELNEVLQLCDAVTVLRDGAVAGAGRAAEYSVDRLVALMVGRELRPSVREASATPGPAVLELRGLRRAGAAARVSLAVGAGEIVGLFGLMGAGRSELLRTIFGLDTAAEGTVLLDGRPLDGPPRRRIGRGLALVTEDRRGDGLCLEASTADNLTLVHLARLTRTPLGIVHPGRFRAAVRAAAAGVRLTGAPRLEAAVGRLSGGNQQKVVLGKWLMGEPRVLLLDEPTRGIDVGARAEIYELLHALAGRGTGVLVVSSELEELTALCDRLLVMRRGELTAAFTRGGFEREAILRAALPETVAS